MNKKTVGAYILASAFFMPLFASAAPGNFSDVVNLILNNIFRPIVALLFGFALVVFLYNMAQYIGNAGDAKGRDEARQYIIASIAGMAVMASVWGLVALVTNTFGLGGQSTPPVFPQF